MALPAVEPAAGGFGLRFATAALLAPMALGAALLGGVVFAVLVLVAAVGLAWEWSRLVAVSLVVVAVVIVACWSVAAPLGPWPGFAAVAAGAGAAWLATRCDRGDRTRALWALLGVIYIGVPMVALLALRARPEDGAVVVGGLFLVVWATDTGAFVVGRAIGGPRLAPRWSPGKTWAGAVGGVLGAVLVASVVVAAGWAPRPWLVLGVCLLLSVTAQVGDLAESLIKRHFHRKDSGRVLPGHGGLFDRLDSLLATAPVLALVVASGGDDAWLLRGSP